MKCIADIESSFNEVT